MLSSNDRYWLNANLNYQTEDSDCLNDIESNCKSLGRLYSWKEAQEVCPANWKLPDFQDFRELYKGIASEEIGEESGIFTLPYNWKNFNADNLGKINMNQNEMKHKKKYLINQSFNLWLRSTSDSDASHIHAYESIFKKNKEKISQLSIFAHNHEKKKSIRFKRKFGVRCVIPISEFNKLSIDNG